MTTRCPCGSPTHRIPERHNAVIAYMRDLYRMAFDPAAA